MKTTEARTITGMNWKCPMNILIDQMGYILRESSRESHKLSIKSKIIQIEVPSKTLSSKYDGRQKVTIVSDYWYLSGTQNVI